MAMLLTGLDVLAAQRGEHAANRSSLSWRALATLLPPKPLPLGKEPGRENTAPQHWPRRSGSGLFAIAPLQGNFQGS